MIVKLLLVIVSLCAVGCLPSELHHSPALKSSVSQKLRYIKDSRVDLCYAVVESVVSNAFVVVSITEVPCEKVSHMLNGGEGAK